MNRIGVAITVVGAIAGCKGDEPAPRATEATSTVSEQLSDAEQKVCHDAGYLTLSAFAATTGDKAMDLKCARWDTETRAAMNAAKGRDARPADLRR